MKKILVIDDEESILEVVQLVLEGEGYDVQTSVNSDLLPHFNGKRPHLILLDVLLSGTDGRDICRQLKSNPQTAHIPIILLSAHSDADKLADASGADDFLEKPFDVDVLVAKVEKHLVLLSPEVLH